MDETRNKLRTEHSAYYQYELIQSACEKDVIILCLPPHTTYDAQPLDCSVCIPEVTLATNLFSIIQEGSSPNLILMVFFSKACLNAATPVNFITGFRKCGVYPFNATANAVNDGSYLTYFLPVSPAIQLSYLLLSDQFSCPLRSNQTPLAQ